MAMRVWSCCSEYDTSLCCDEFVTAAMYLIMIFDDSVFPAPDSPEITTQVSVLFRFIVRYA